MTSWQSFCEVTIFITHVQLVSTLWAVFFYDKRGARPRNPVVSYRGPSCECQAPKYEDANKQKEHRGVQAVQLDSFQCYRMSRPNFPTIWNRSKCGRRCISPDSSNSQVEGGQLNCTRLTKSRVKQILREQSVSSQRVYL